MLVHVSWWIHFFDIDDFSRSSTLDILFVLSGFQEGRFPFLSFRVRLLPLVWTLTWWREHTFAHYNVFRREFLNCYFFVLTCCLLTCWHPFSSPFLRYGYLEAVLLLAFI